MLVGDALHQVQVVPLGLAIGHRLVKNEGKRSLEVVFVEHAHAPNQIVRDDGPVVGVLSLGMGGGGMRRNLGKFLVAVLALEVAEIGTDGDLAVTEFEDGQQLIRLQRQLFEILRENLDTFVRPVGMKLLEGGRTLSDVGILHQAAVGMHGIGIAGNHAGRAGAKFARRVDPTADPDCVPVPNCRIRRCDVSVVNQD